MELLQIIGIGLVTAIITLIVKQYRPEIGIMLPILATCTILAILIPYINSAIHMFEDIAGQVGIENQYLKIVIKIIGVTYICQFSAELCKDSGESALAGRIEFAGKIVVLVISMPIVYQILEVVTKIINY